MIGMDIDTSDLVVSVLLVVMVAAVGYSAYRAVLAERGFNRFIREHNFRKSPPASTMWLARVIENAAGLQFVGEWDGLPVTIDRHRNGRSSGMTIVVSAASDLVPASAGNVSIGPWTKPAPPELLQHGLVASGSELRLRMGDTPDPAPYSAAAVAYARSLATQPIRMPAPQMDD
jgi:hypothetical protein